MLSQIKNIYRKEMKQKGNLNDSFVFVFNFLINSSCSIYNIVIIIAYL